jgi:hypothetical protein
VTIVTINQMTDTLQTEKGALKARLPLSQHQLLGTAGFHPPPCASGHHARTLRTRRRWKGSLNDGRQRAFPAFGGHLPNHSRHR